MSKINTSTSLVPFNSNVSTGVTVTTSSSVRTAIGSVGTNLITSVKSVTTLEVPKNPIVKPVTKIEQETVPIINGFTSKQIKEMSLEDLRKIGSSETTSSNAIKKLKGTKEEALKFFESRVVGEIETKVNPAGKPEAQEFQWGTAGSMMQQTPDGPKNIIPALRYDNPNSRGMNFIKFDGIEVRDGTTYLIDAKRNVPHWNKSAMKNLIKTFDRINEAKNQNPEIKVIYEFPNEKAKTKFTDWLDRNPGYQNIIDEIRVRPEK